MELKLIRTSPKLYFVVTKESGCLWMMLVYFRTLREAFIRAKYVDKAFVVKLPGPKTSGNTKMKGWSVRKKTKRIPSRSGSHDESQNDVESDLTSGIMEGKALLSFSTFTFKISLSYHMLCSVFDVQCCFSIPCICKF